MRRKAEAVGVGRGWKEEMNAERLDLDRQAYAQRPHNERGRKRLEGRGTWQGVREKAQNKDETRAGSSASGQVHHHSYP